MYQKKGLFTCFKLIDIFLTHLENNDLPTKNDFKEGIQVLFGLIAIIIITEPEMNDEEKQSVKEQFSHLFLKALGFG